MRTKSRCVEMGYTIEGPGKELPITMQPETMDLQRNEHVFSRAMDNM